MPNMETSLLRVSEAARLLRVSKWTIYRWIEEGRLHATKIGRGSMRIFRASVNELIEGARTVHREAQQGLRAEETRERVTRQRKTRRAR
jgi:excisionase family DNA binding protein